MSRPMGVFFIASYLHKPSHLWMRRQLDQLGDHVAVLADMYEVAAPYDGRYRTLAIDEWRPDFEQITAAVEDEAVTAVLVQFLTVGVRLAPVWQATDKPVFIHCHGFDVTWEMRDQAYRVGRIHAPDYVQRVLALPDHVRFIANSCYTRDRLLSAGVPPQRVTVKFMGVEAPDEPPQRGSDGDCDLLYLGRLVDCKGPDLLIRAFERAASRGMAGRLVIAGDGPMRLTCELLKQRSPAADRIELVGEVDAQQGEALRRRAGVFTAHSCRGPVSGQEEAFGVSFLEAMAGGLPVVTGASGGVCEVVEDGVTGLLFEPGDVAAHAEALLRLAGDRDLRHRLGRNAWQRVRERFAIDREGAELRRVLGLGHPAGAKA